MKKVIEDVLKLGDYDLADILRKIDTLWVRGVLTDDEYNTLNSIARDNAKPSNSVDVMARFDDIERRLRALEGKETAEGEVEGYPEYQDGNWYYKGDKCFFEGATYTCVAPDGVVCVWSPSAYPTYWEKAI